MDEERDSLLCVYKHWMDRLVTTGNGSGTTVSSHFRSLYTYDTVLFFLLGLSDAMMTIKNSTERELRSCRRYYKNYLKGPAHAVLTYSLIQSIPESSIVCYNSSNCY